MAEYKISINDEILQRLFYREEGMARLVEEVVNQALEAQVGERLKAGRYERAEERQGYRNGYREKHIKTRIGKLTITVPRVREGTFSSEVFASLQRCDQALLLALMEMVVNGVSTRKVAKITEELCGTQFSKSTVSELCRGLDPVVKEWNDRPLGGKAYPFLVVDALFVRVRQEGRVRMQSVLIATGINQEGRREILGVQVGDSESEDTWDRFFGRLKERGLTGVDLVVSDDHKGLVKAIQTNFQGATWQRCQAHFIRNLMDACPKALQKEMHGKLRMVFDAPDEVTCRRLKNEVVAEYEKTAPRVVERLETGFEDAIAVMALPEPCRRRLRTTNGVERLNEEVRRRERVIRIFPNVDSALRLIGAVLVEKDEEWSTDKRYINMDAYWEWKRPEQAAVKPQQLQAQAA